MGFVDINVALERHGLVIPDMGTFRQVASVALNSYDGDRIAKLAVESRRSGYSCGFTADVGPQRLQVHPLGNQGFACSIFRFDAREAEEFVRDEEAERLVACLAGLSSLWVLEADFVAEAGEDLMVDCSWFASSLADALELGEGEFEADDLITEFRRAMRRRGGPKFPLLEEEGLCMLLHFLAPSDERFLEFRVHENTLFFPGSGRRHCMPWSAVRLKCVGGLPGLAVYDNDVVAQLRMYRQHLIELKCALSCAH